MRREPPTGNRSEGTPPSRGSSGGDEAFNGSGRPAVTPTGLKSLQDRDAKAVEGSSPQVGERVHVVRVGVVRALVAREVLVHALVRAVAAHVHVVEVVGG